MAKKRNFYREAFFKIPNLIFLGIGALAAVVTGSIVLAGVVAGIEAAAVFGIGKSSWFRRGVYRKKGWGGALVSVEDRAKQASALNEENALRYRTLRMHYRTATDRAAKDFSDEPLVIAAIQKLEGLSDTYLKLLLTRQRAQDFLDATDLGDLEEKRSSSQKEAELTTDPEVAKMRAKSAEMIADRIDRVGQAGKTLSRIDEQLKMIDNSVLAIRDKIMTAERQVEVASSIDLMTANLEDAEKTITETESLVYTEPIDDQIPAMLREKVR